MFSVVGFPHGPVSATPLSLLERLRTVPDPQSWKRLVDLYTPFIQRQLQKHHLQHHDVDDLVQDVLSTVLEKLASFEHRAPGAFRGWLRAITANKLKGCWRAAGARPLVGNERAWAELDRLEDPASDQSRLWDDEHNRHVISRLLTLLEREFDRETLTIFHRYAIEGKKPADVAAALAVEINVVYLTKSRVLARLREEAHDLID